MTAGTMERLAAARIVPVVEIDDAGAAVPLVDALAHGGLHTVEITLRTPAALDAVRRIVAERPGCTVGAGTVLRSADVEAALDAGAEFLVSPGRTAALSAAARDAGLPLMPGTATASEVLAAAEDGHRWVKFFPAEALGGAAAVAALAAPLRAADVRFMPTGGIRAEHVAGYLALDAVFAVGGTWIATRELLRARRFDEIASRATTAAGLIA